MSAGDYKVEVETGPGHTGEWFADAPDGASATVITADNTGADRADFALAP